MWVLFPTERGTVLIGGFDFQRSGGYSFDGFCFRRRGRGALCSPTPPRVTGARGFTPSRALPELVWRGVWFPTMQGCSFDGIRFRRCGNCSLEVFRSRRRGRGALCSPTSPRGTGCERVATLSRSPGVGVTRNLVSGDAGNVLLREFVSDGTGVGRSAPLHPLGGRGARGFTPSRALPGLLWRGFWFVFSNG